MQRQLRQNDFMSYYRFGLKTTAARLWKSINHRHRRQQKKDLQEPDRKPNSCHPYLINISNERFCNEELTGYATTWAVLTLNVILYRQTIRPYPGILAAYS